jgi:hypothetical protein
MGMTGQYRRVTPGTLEQLELSRRYDGPRMDAAEIYAGGWTDDENLEWLVEAYVSVRDDFSAAAADADGMLLYLT